MIRLTKWTGTMFTIRLRLLSFTRRWGIALVHQEKKPSLDSVQVERPGTVHLCIKAPESDIKRFKAGDRRLTQMTQHKFQVGDTVRRTVGADYPGLYYGRMFVVDSVYGDGWSQDNDGLIHDPENLELVKRAEVEVGDTVEFVGTEDYMPLGGVVERISDGIYFYRSPRGLYGAVSDNLRITKKGKKLVNEAKTPEAKSIEQQTLEELVETANRGSRAENELQKKYAGRVQVKSIGEEEHEWRELISFDSFEYRLKPAPSFTPFHVNNGQWLVKLDGEMLRVGCFTPTAKQAQYLLKRVCREGANSAMHAEYSVEAIRGGILCRGPSRIGPEKLSFEDADTILAALEAALGVKK